MYFFIFKIQQDGSDSIQESKSAGFGLYMYTHTCTHMHKFPLDRVICLHEVTADTRNSQEVPDTTRFNTWLRKTDRPSTFSQSLTLCFVSQRWRTAGFSCWIFLAVNSKCHWQTSQFLMKEDTFASSTPTPHRKVTPPSQSWVRNACGAYSGKWNGDGPYYQTAYSSKEKVNGEFSCSNLFQEELPPILLNFKNSLFYQML